MFDSLMLQRLWLVPVGVIVGAYGTLIGAGGGFLLVPLLLLLYPQEKPEIVTSISLAVVFFNALSGSIAYTRMRRIDYRSGLLFSAATVPGAIFGALTTSFIPRPHFDMIFGMVLIAGSIFLIFQSGERSMRETPSSGDHAVGNLTNGSRGSHSHGYSPVTGIGLSLVVGYFSSLLGIGGGIIHVPTLVHFLNFPVHIATATSQFILSIMTFTGSMVHVVSGAFHHGIRRTVALSIGVLLGAQLGALLSQRMKGLWIIRALALALGLVGIRILLQAIL